MALCVYHETTEATQACRVCKQDVCAKCLEYGEAGMCGMCLEMANARKATMEAARQARTEAAATAPSAAQPPRPAAPRPPQGAPPPGGRSPTGPKGPPKSPTGSKGPAPAGHPRGAAPGGAGAPPRPPQKAPTKAGMCAAHQDQKASAACTHCQKKVCPYCLDLYDLCGDCRQLPSCARHESMVSQAKCVSCKMDYCKICLNGTDQCDRCRTIGAPRGEGAKSPTQPLKPRAKATTGKLEGPPGGVPAGPKPEKVKPASHIYRPNAKEAGLHGKKKGKDLPIPAIAGGAVLAIVLVLFLSMGGGKPALSEEAAVEALQLDMGHVQAAAIAYEAKNGRYPDSEEMIYQEIEAKGVKLDKLKLPIKLAVNTPASEPYQISYRLVGDGFEVRAVDKEGRPFALGGRDVVLTNQVQSTPEAGP
jgi:hypothetical protein